MNTNNAIGYEYLHVGDRNQHLAIHMACAYRHPRIVERLLPLVVKFSRSKNFANYGDMFGKYEGRGTINDTIYWRFPLLYTVVVPPETIKVPSDKPGDWDTRGVECIEQLLVHGFSFEYQHDWRVGIVPAACRAGQVAETVALILGGANPFMHIEEYGDSDAGQATACFEMAIAKIMQGGVHVDWRSAMFDAHRNWVLGNTNPTSTIHVNMTMRDKIVAEAADIIAKYLPLLNLSDTMYENAEFLRKLSYKMRENAEFVKFAKLAQKDGVGHLLYGLYYHNGIAAINVCMPDEYGSKYLPLTYAIETGRNLEHITTLIDNGADVNLCDMTQMNAVHVACSVGNDSLVRLLIEKYKGDINKKIATGSSYSSYPRGHNRGGDTLLIIAARHHHANLVDYLLIRIAEHADSVSRINEVNTSKGNALHAIFGNIPQRSHEVLDRNGILVGDPYARDDDRTDVYTVIDRLCAAGINVDAENGNNESAMYVACEPDTIEIAKMLLERGASPEFNIPEGRWAYETRERRDLLVATMGGLDGIKDLHMRWITELPATSAAVEINTRRIVALDADDAERKKYAEWFASLPDMDPRRLQYQRLLGLGLGKQTKGAR
jgi:hypothetical protein